MNNNLKTEKNFVDIYNKNYALVYSKLFSKLRNADDAEELTQEVFLIYYKNFVKVEYPRQWLLKTAQYLFYNKINCKTKNSVSIDQELLELSDNKRQNIETEIVLANIIEAKENYKSDQEKEIFELVVKNKYTYSSAAKSLGITERQVRYKYTKLLSNFLNSFRKIGLTRLQDVL